MEDWKSRLRERYGIDTSNFQFNPETPHRVAAADEVEEEGIDWGSWYHSRAG